MNVRSMRLEADRGLVEVEPSVGQREPGLVDGLLRGEQQSIPVPVGTEARQMRPFLGEEITSRTPSGSGWCGSASIPSAVISSARATAAARYPRQWVMLPTVPRGQSGAPRSPGSSGIGECPTWPRTLSRSVVRWRTRGAGLPPLPPRQSPPAGTAPRPRRRRRHDAPQSPTAEFSRSRSARYPIRRSRGVCSPDHAVPQRHGGVRPRMHTDTVVRPDLRVLERERSRMAADDAGIAADQHETVDSNRPEGVKDGTPRLAHRHGARIAECG